MCACLHVCVCVCAHVRERETTIEDKEATSKVSEQGVTGGKKGEEGNDVI